MSTPSPQHFRPQVENLSDRIVPSANPKAQFVADANAAFQHALHGQLTAADYAAINADVREIQTQYATAITQLITYFNTLPQSQKTALTEEALSIIDDLQTAEQYIAQAAYNLELSLYEYDLGVIQTDPNFAMVHYAQANLDLSTAIQYYTSPFISEADSLVTVIAAFPTSQTSTSSGTIDPDNDGDDDTGLTY